MSIRALLEFTKSRNRLALDVDWDEPEALLWRDLGSFSERVGRDSESLPPPNDDLNVGVL
jgi:hypothetical protein